MKGRQPQEREEVDHISLSDARSHPWTVVVLFLNAHPTGAAVEGSWRSEQVACRAQAERVAFDLGPGHMRDSEPVFSVEVLYIARFEVALVFSHVFDLVAPALVHVLRGDARDDTWLGVSAFEQNAEAVVHAQAQANAGHDSTDKAECLEVPAREKVQLFNCATEVNKGPNKNTYE